MKKPKATFLLSGAIVTGLVLSVLIYIRANTSTSNIPIPCLTGYSGNMSPVEMSEFFDVPLVTLATLPDGLLAEPTVMADVEYPIESPVCGLEIRYFDGVNKWPQIAIEVIKVDATNSIAEWLCFNYPSEFNQPEMGGFQSVCSNTLDSQNVKLYIRVSTQYPSEEARSIVDEVRIADGS